MDSLGTLMRLGGGNLIDDLHEALAHVAAEVARTGRPGSVTLTLKVTHPQGSDPALVVVADEVKRTVPKSEPRGAMYFALDGELHSRDPRQPELPEFRVVNTPDGQTRMVNAATGEIREA